ncbi:MAG: hypothetical protein WKG01_28985 [Kofleriaceae bacterium]
MRHVRGVLFVDYVRMLRSHKAGDWRERLPAEDLMYLTMSIDVDAWYPMATFERMGNEILRTVARGEMFPVQLWGRYQAAALRNAKPELLAAGNAIETLNRFRTLRDTFFDYKAIEVRQLDPGRAQIAIAYHMGMPAEEAASFQTMGYFETLLELAGAKNLRAEFRTRSWAGDPETILVLQWV